MNQPDEPARPTAGGGADARQRLYLVADELRGMSALMREFAADVYTRERADRLAELALKLAAIAEEATVEEVRARFPRDDWSRVSPAVGVEAAVFDETGGVLLVRRRDNGLWALPGGIAEIGQTLPEAALRELWEEAGLRGEAVRLLGVFDGRLWGSRSRVHIVHHVFLAACPDTRPTPGVEMLEARFFPQDDLPTDEEMHPGHERRIPRVIALASQRETYFDSADTLAGELPMHQRPEV